MSVVDGARDASGVLLYLHGRCGDPEAFRAFAPAIPRSLTLIAVRGDVRCKGSARTRWSLHAPTIDLRLRRVVEAVSAVREGAGAAPLARSGWIVFGYSEGALRAEALIARHPDRYVAGVLGGGPRAPRTGSLDRAGGILLLAGDRDARGHLQQAAEDLTRRGVRARFTLLPDAAHGEYGPEAERVVGDGLRWLLGGPPFNQAGTPLQN